MSVKIKKCCFLYILINILAFAYAQEIRPGIKLPAVPDWYSVYPGNSICPLQKTSFGFAFLTDSRDLVFCNESGKVKYCTTLKYKTQKYFFTGLSDFAYVISTSNVLHVYNSTGSEVSKSDLNSFMNESLAENPVCLSDGSILMRTKNSIYCLNIKGFLKWKKNIENQDFSIPLLKDDSIYKNSVVFSVLTEGGSKILCLTSFGFLFEVYETPFRVERILSVGNGLFVLDSKGQVFGGKNEGLSLAMDYCRKTDQNIRSARFFAGENQDMFFVLCDDRIFAVNAMSVSCQIAEFYTFNESSEKNETVNISKAAIINGHIVFANDDWSVNAFKLNFPSRFNENKINAVQNEKAANSSFSDITGAGIETFERAFDESKDLIEIDELYDLLKKDKNFKTVFYADPKYFLSLDFHSGDLHKFYLSNASKSANQDKEYVLQKTDNAVKFLEIISSLGLTDFGFVFWDCLTLDKNWGNVARCLVFAANLKYDEGYVLDAIEKMSRNPQMANSPSLANHMCDCVYEICVFMGTPTFFAKGKSILASMLTGDCNDDVKRLARQTYQRMMSGFQQGGNGTKR